MILLEQPKTVLYHGSPIGGLKIIRPHKSTHGISYVYATPYLGIAITYLGKWDDFDLASGTINDIPYVVERYRNALKTIYSKPGYIYTVEPYGFKTDYENGVNGFELVNENPVKVIDCKRVANPYKAILDMPKEEFKVFLYPNRPKFIPKDDKDLIGKANYFYAQTKDPKVYDELYSKHPHLRTESAFV